MPVPVSKSGNRVRTLSSKSSVKSKPLKHEYATVGPNASWTSIEHDLLPMVMLGEYAGQELVGQSFSGF